jgi:exopolyphosphatase/guanosine-5'-triphosphate,3'-diphosphate pyrophosphatase
MEVEALRTMVRVSTAEMEPLLRHVPGMTCVGTAGTITTLAAMAQRLDRFEHRRIHNYRVMLDDIVQLEGELCLDRRRNGKGCRDWNQGAKR